MNSSLILFEPSAAPLFIAGVTSELQALGVKCDSTGTIPADNLRDATDGSAPLQFSPTLARYACTPPQDLVLTQQAHATFEAAVGSTWAAAVSERLVLSAAEALAQVGSADALAAAWRNAPLGATLGPDMHIAFMQLRPMQYRVVVNGFFPALRERLAASLDDAWWIIAEWPETSTVTHASIAAAVDAVRARTPAAVSKRPSRASSPSPTVAAGSAKAAISAARASASPPPTAAPSISEPVPDFTHGMQRWRVAGFSTQPYVHCSAGAVQSALERTHVWKLPAPGLATDAAIGEALKAASLDAAATWANPVVKVTKAFSSAPAAPFAEATRCTLAAYIAATAATAPAPVAQTFNVGQRAFLMDLLAGRSIATAQAALQSVQIEPPASGAPWKSNLTAAVAQLHAATTSAVPAVAVSPLAPSPPRDHPKPVSARQAQQHTPPSEPAQQVPPTTTGSSGETTMAGAVRRRSSVTFSVPAPLSGLPTMVQVQKQEQSAAPAPSASPSAPATTAAGSPLASPVVNAAAAASPADGNAVTAAPATPTKSVDQAAAVDTSAATNASSLGGLTPGARNLSKAERDKRRRRLRMSAMTEVATDEEMRALFDLFDTDGSGYIGRMEFQEELAKFENYGLALPASAINDLFDRYDTRRDGRLSYDQFALVMYRRIAM